MPNTTHPDILLVEQIRAGQPDAWNVLISQYEGRLLSFVDSRLHRRASSEDVVASASGVECFSTVASDSPTRVLNVRAT